MPGGFSGIHTYRKTMIKSQIARLILHLNKSASEHVHTHRVLITRLGTSELDKGASEHVPTSRPEQQTANAVAPAIALARD